MNTNANSVQSRIIVALDVSSLETLGPLIEVLAPHVGCFKIGLELISSVGGPQAVQFIHERGGRVFYDGKFDDIPNTISKASAAVAKLRVAMFNVHASSGVPGMKAAVDNKGEAAVLAVTVLTSHDHDASIHIFGASNEEAVAEFAKDAHSAGVDGIICSPLELSILAENEDLNGLRRITPGIRSKNAPPDDQKRTMTAAEAIMAGATELVIGRPILKSPDGLSPAEAARAFNLEIAEALQRKASLSEGEKP